jgi:hypothetical protein
MINNDRYLFRASDIYYINEKNFYHYQENMPQTKTIRLSSGKPLEQTDTPELLPTATAATLKIDSGRNSALKTEMWRIIDS